ncbi:MAG: exodeoxyribonuclease VII small subunit [Ruminococcaceae bacterium]|nr:exodeoxyribonuclease VII small subunit [Oscillospiraceae bacterium]
MAEKKKFEQIMAELTQVVEELEQGQPDLDRALSLFEQGVKLTKECQKILDQAEQKVTRLVQAEDGEIEEKPFS